MEPRQYQQNINQDFEEPMKTPGNPTGKEKVFDTKKIVAGVIGAVIGVVAVAGGIVFLLQYLSNSGDTPVEPTNTSTAEPEPKELVPEKIDLQLALNQWVTTQTAANSGVVVYDLDNNAVVARHNEGKQFRIESIYKMFVAYEGYYRVDHDVWKGTDKALNWNSYDGTPYTISLCLDHMIRYSYSSCAENLWQRIGHQKLQEIYNEKGFKNTSIDAITSTASDLTKLYQLYWAHSDLSDESWDKIQDSMFNQSAPKSAGSPYTSNWRQGLPSGFATAKVYDKVGWLGDGNGHWIYYADAAFLEFPEVEKNHEGEKKPARHYIMIALTQNTNYKELVKLGRKIEDAVKTADNY